MTWYQEWFGEEYLDLYSYRDEEEARHHIQFFQEHIGPVTGPVLDLACGSGRHLQELSSAHYEAVGCDLSHVLLRTASEGPSLTRLVRADMRKLPFANESFGALVNFFTSFGYFEHEDDNADVVAEMCRVLRPRSPFLFDYLNVHRELRGLVQREERACESGVVRIERWFDAASRTFNKRITLGPKRFLERVRGYDLEEITAMFTGGGLAIRHLFGDFDGSPFTSESPRMIIIGVRRS